MPPDPLPAPYSASQRADSWAWIDAVRPESIIWILVIGATVLAVWWYRAGSDMTRQRMTEGFASPIAGASFALLALVAGTISQFYPAKITSAIPLTYADRSPISAALGFWVTVFLMFVVGVAYYAASGNQRVQESEEVRRHTTSLIDTLRTLPPEGFMRDYPSLCADMLAHYTQAVRDPTPDKVRLAIRRALRSTALMAHRFGRRGLPENYTASVMRFRTAAVLGPPHAWSASQRALYPSGFATEEIQGALVRDPTLATRATSADAGPLAGAKDVRIIIPEPPRDAREGGAAEGRLRVLPGSAVAYVLARPYLAYDTHDMRPSKAEFDLSESVIDASDAYFRTGDGKGIRSFVSLPLFVEPARMAGPTIGTLNVEFSDVEIFRSEETVENFFLAVAPVHFVIVLLLTLLAAVEGSSEAPVETPAPVAVTGAGEGETQPGGTAEEAWLK